METMEEKQVHGKVEEDQAKIREHRYYEQTKYDWRGTIMQIAHTSQRLVVLILTLSATYESS